MKAPPGSGKSTFLNNLLQKLEHYSSISKGATYKVYWRINRDYIKSLHKFQVRNGIKNGSADTVKALANAPRPPLHECYGDPGECVEFSCPSHDHPIVMIPIKYRREFLEEIIKDDEFKKKLFTEKQYEWVFNRVPCNICNSLFKSLLDFLDNPMDVYDYLMVRRNSFSRQLGEGISVFNPGDQPVKGAVVNLTIQNQLNELFKHEDIKFQSSYLAKTNNGVLALMDIKGYNVNRLRNLHGIISDGIHKVELVDENINSLFMGLINPADKHHYEDMPSFRDRIITVNIPYILDYNAEIAVYRNKFGDDIDKRFLPGVMENFAKIIISTRLDVESSAMKEWIVDPKIYSKYMDKNMLLLRMDVYTGRIPSYLTDEDMKRFVKARRKKVLAESETQGQKGISGRQSLLTFNRLLGKYADSDKLITMEMLKNFCEEEIKSLGVIVPFGFMDSLVDLYDYNVVQELKEAIYFYNETQVKTQILDYLFAINFEPDVTKVSDYTGSKINITEAFFDEFEKAFHGADYTAEKRKAFRKETQREYVTQTVAREMRVDNKDIVDTTLFLDLFERYDRQLKESSLKPYLSNDTFRRAIQDYGTPNFKSYGESLRRDIERMLINLQKKFSYSKSGVSQICFYVLEKGIGLKY